MRRVHECPWGVRRSGPTTSRDPSSRVGHLRRTTWLALTFAFAIGIPATGSAQLPTVVDAVGDTLHGVQIRPDSVYEMQLQDGTILHGQVMLATADEVTFETAGGTRVSVERGQIRTLRLAVGRIVDGRFLPHDPNRTRLFFAPTARPLERGESYVSSYMLIFPFAGLGVTDRLTLAGGTPILPGIMGKLFYLAPKYTVSRREGFDIAVGGLAFFLTGEIDEGSLGILYGVGTFGDPDRALTAGAGWGFMLGGGESRINGNPVVTLGGELRAGERVKFLTENWFQVDGGESAGILTGGVRFFGERLSADLGLGLSFGEAESFCCMPLVNFVYNIQRGP